MGLTFREFLLEGGWSNTVTQGVRLTPKIAKEAISILARFEKDFNLFLKKKDLPPISIGKPVGSSTYIDLDILTNPSKEYGDIDVILSIPRIEGMIESKNNSIYSKAIQEFVSSSNLPYLFKDNSNMGNNIIVKVNDDWVQVDLVKSFSDIVDWVQHRMTPQHNLKGALLGYLYSSLASVLNLSIGSSGVQAKEKDGTFIAFKNLKADKVDTLTTDIGNFGVDILKGFAKRHKVSNLEISKLLKQNPGMNRSNIQVKDLVNVIKGLGKSFELNSMFGAVELKHIKNYEDYMSKIKSVYEKKTTEAASASKFNKAETEEAKKRAQETKDILLNKSKEILALLED